MTKDDLARAVVGLPGSSPAWAYLTSIHFNGLDDAATGGVLVAMVPPEHRHRVQWREGWANWAWLGPAAESPHKHRLWQPADSQGHAAALVLVDCGWCHGG